MLFRILSLAAIALLLAAVAACSNPSPAPTPAEAVSPAANASAEATPTSGQVVVTHQASPTVVDQAAPDELGGVTPRADLLGAEGQTYTTVEVVKLLKPSVVQVLTEVVAMDFFGMPVPDTGAAELGLREGDAIVQLGDTPIRNTGDLSKFLRKHLAGETVVIVYYRGPQKITADIRISERPATP